MYEKDAMIIQVRRPNILRKLAAAIRHPFNSQNRRMFRAPQDHSLNARLARSYRVGTLNIAAAIRHPFSSKNRKNFRERKTNAIVDNYIPIGSSDPYFRVYQQYTGTATHLAVEEIGAIALKSPPTARCDVKLIAYYLPQFHPIPENDRNWGKGFTEWNNVAKAVPAFVGHYQPRQPGELGFYDLRIVDVMRRQVELAKLYGISAFCFHFYWFGGKRLLELPIQNYLENKELNLPFCLCWANENWSRRWDGSEDELLLAQSHSPKDDIAFIRYLKRYFDDPRYIKIDGKPVLTVYRPAILPNIRETVARWRHEIREMGFPGLFLIATNSFDFMDYEDAGFDALSEFPPHGLVVDNISHTLPSLFHHAGWVFRYKDVVENHEKYAPRGRVILPGVMPAWDNSARRPLKGNLFHASTPALFEQWLDASMERAKRNPPDMRMVFINAWNEWAEGAYLEPDRRFGYAYLSACASAVRKHADRDPHAMGLLRRQRERFRRKNDKAIAIHLFYEDLGPRIAEYLQKFEKTDLFITICDDISLESAQTLVSIFPEAYFQEMENIGRDIRPFLAILRELLRHDYKYICKIHSKRSTHLQEGELWRDELISILLSDEASHALVALENEKNTGMLAALNSVMSLADPYVRRHTEGILVDFTKRMGIEFNPNEKFIAGSMFWFKPQALKSLSILYETGIKFDPELGQIDGTVAHAMERLFVIAAKSEGYGLQEFGRAVQNPYN